jgi:hypothetical protein
MLFVWRIGIANDKIISQLTFLIRYIGLLYLNTNEDVAEDNKAENNLGEEINNVVFLTFKLFNLYNAHAEKNSVANLVFVWRWCFIFTI